MSSCRLKVVVYNPAIYGWHDEVVGLLRDIFEDKVCIEEITKKDLETKNIDLVDPTTTECIVWLYIGDELRKRLVLETVSDVDELLKFIEVMVLWNY